MEHHIERLLNRLSLSSSPPPPQPSLSSTSSSNSSCSSSASRRHSHHHLTLSLSPFPSYTCDLSPRDLLTPEKQFRKLAATRSFGDRRRSFSLLFQTLASLRLLSNSSRVLVVSSGAGHEVVALQDSGVSDVTAVDLVNFPPLVKRADPHNLPFFEGLFDLGFSAGLEGALFPRRFAEEMERTVMNGGAEAEAVERAGSAAGELEGILALFRRSSLVEVRIVTLVGSEMSMIVMRNNGMPP